MKTPDAALNRNYGVYVALIPATALLVIWSLGISAMIRKEFDPGIPQWIVVPTVAAAIIGASLLIGRLMRTKIGQKLTGVLLITCLMVPLIATAFGGIYLWASEHFARKREPWATLILAAGLGVTVFGFGLATHMEAIHMILVFTASVLGLVSLCFLGRKSSMGLMRFGALHFVTLLAAMVVASIEDSQRRLEGGNRTLEQKTKAEQGAAGQPATTPQVGD